MAVDGGTFETLVPSQFISLTIRNPLYRSNSSPTPYGALLRIAVLDSPVGMAGEPPGIAAMLVPVDREHDWIFSTKEGHLQLLLNSQGISRLILVGNLPQSSGDYYNRGRLLNNTEAYQVEIEESLTLILFGLLPKACFKNGLPQIPFLAYEDNVIRSSVVEKCFGSCVGEMLVEDIEIEIHDEVRDLLKREFRRRLRFKRMPNFVQTEIRISPCIIDDSVNVELEGEVKFWPEMGVLVHPYLPPMVASLSLIANYIQQKLDSGSRPRVLCVGVGGGALLTFLASHFGFEVMGVEADEMVLRVARAYFGLKDGEFLRVCVGDGIEVLDKFSRHAIDQNLGSSSGHVDTDGCLDIFGGCYDRMDLMMVDLDSGDVRNGISAPPSEFIQKSVLVAVKLALHKLGILVINVIPPSRSFYDYVILQFREVFSELYEIDVGNGENYVLIATASSIGSVYDSENYILKKLKLVLAVSYLDSIRKI
ncbi:eEF1A lysine and N-terminal methyltransferase [Macadamia integrifolia]|uniref:eEF1A lysine and N-terminal methyltransferase n=1 Tax=Macadamia integrifolia TaxID=60698 RepID=UPI001C4ED540|nr:eEF1A lysine and N-terminal methyltransferase [Macadamia integrifolia]